MVKTPPFHGGNMGSSPVWVTTYLYAWEHSSAGRASALQAEGHRFEPCCAHHYFGLVAQLVRVLACHAGGRGFESLPGRHIKEYLRMLFFSFREQHKVQYKNHAANRFINGVIFIFLFPLCSCLSLCHCRKTCKG